MALNSLGLGFLFTAKDAASGTIRRLSGNFNQLGAKANKGGRLAKGAMIGLGASAAVAGLGVAGLVAGVSAAGAFGEFEQGIANVGATMNATEEEMKALSKRAIQAGIDTQFSPVEATKGLDSLAAAGQNVDQAMTTLGATLDLAAGSKGQLGLAESAEAVVGTLNSYGFSAEKATEVTDKLLLATQKSNFQARDFSTGLAKAAAAGSQFDQELNTVLATMGFLRNANIDASSSATAFREATRKLGSDTKAQQAITKEGIDIFDKQTGKMRQLPLIMFDLAKKTKDMGSEERNRIVTQAFGARGMLAFNAVSKATFSTMKDGKKVTLTGKDAFLAFTESLDKAGGTAKKTRERLLATFEGQKTLLAGTLSTLAIVSGKAFSEIFGPIVSSVTKFLNVIIKAIEGTPKPIKKLLGGLFLAVSAFLTMAGGTGILVAGFVLLLPVLKIVAIAIGILALVMVPIIAGFALATLVVIGFRQAMDKNIGGIGASMAGTFNKIKLTLSALFQFFSEGKISGAIAEDLAKAENEGVLNFVNRVVQLVQSVINFFGGISTGFSEGIEGMGPTFEKLVASFEKLGQALGFLGTESGADDARERFDKFGETGEKVGAVIAFAFDMIVGAIISVVDFVADLVEAFDEADLELKEFKGTLGPLEETLLSLGDAFGISGDQADGSSDRIGKMKAIMEGLASALDKVLTIGSVVFTIIGTAVAEGVSSIKLNLGLLMGAIDIIRAGFNLLAGDTTEAWALLKRGIFRAINAILGRIAFMVAKLARAQKSLGLKIPGVDFEAMAKTLGAARKSLDKSIASENAVLDVQGKIDRKRPGILAGATALAVPGGTLPPPPAGGAPSPVGAAAAGVRSFAASARASQIVSAISRLRVVGGAVSIKVLMDSEEIASRINKNTDDQPGGGDTGT